MRRSVVLPLLLLVVGCSIVQEVKPVDQKNLPGKEICVVQNADVRQGFLDAYKAALESKGFAVRILAPGSGITQCPLLTTYTANWRWDLALYMAYARMTIFRDGQQIGQATYDALVGGGRVFEKFIKADEKIRELVNQLFPG
jgi:hypothetical protein